MIIYLMHRSAAHSLGNTFEAIQYSLYFDGRSFWDIMFNPPHSFCPTMTGSGEEIEWEGHILDGRKTTFKTGLYHTFDKIKFTMKNNPLLLGIILQTLLVQMT